jgi:hypothetical protein
MHDYFEILGVPASAHAVEVRRRCAAHVRRWHPDFRQLLRTDTTAPTTVRPDVAVDFVSMNIVALRLQQQFFGSRPDAI